MRKNRKKIALVIMSCLVDSSDKFSDIEKMMKHLCPESPELNIGDSNSKVIID